MANISVAATASASLDFMHRLVDHLTPVVLGTVLNNQNIFALILASQFFVFSDGFNTDVSSIAQ